MPSKSRSQIFPVAQFNDEAIASVKGNNPNVLVAIGFLGSMVTVLNPASAEYALQRFSEHFERPADEGDTVTILGFVDVFEVYEMKELS